jgi:hypothetical protein
VKHISEVLPDALQEMRELWRHFDLNNSQDAGMRITYDNGEVKSYGTVTETAGLLHCDAIPGPGISSSLAGRNPRGNRASRGGKRG